MRIIHLSDLHIPENGQDIWGINPVNRLNAMASKIKCLKNIDAIIISGDISNDGSLWSYRYVDSIFADINIPTYCCPGNHDNLKLFYAGYKPKFYSTQELQKINDWTFILLNSAVEGMSRGMIDLENLKYLLSQATGNIAIVLHHPPIEQEGWLNRKLLENRDEFNDIVFENHNVKLVLYGHTHYHTSQLFNNIIYSSAPSIGFAFNPTLPKFQIAKGEEGLAMITLDGDNIQIEKILI